MAMDLREYFRLRCSEMLAMERDVWQINSLLIRETADPRLKMAFERHNEPIRWQISNLEQVVDQLDGVVGPEEHPMTQGMMRAHHQFMTLNPTQALIDLHHALEGDKLLHLEIASYIGLISMARHLGEEDFVRLLTQNLESDQRMSTLLENELPALMVAVSMPQQRAA